MWNDGLYLLWSHISKLYYEDLDNGLKIMNKLTNDHIVLNTYSVYESTTYDCQLLATCYCYCQILSNGGHVF